MNRQTIREMQAIREAEAEVEPYVGKVLGCDSADEIYQIALERLGRSTTGLLGAGKAAFRLVAPGGRRVQLASDEQTAERVAMFPNAGRLG